MHDKKITRRSFAKGIFAAGSVFSIVPRYVLGGTGHIAPSDQLTKAVRRLIEHRWCTWDYREPPTHGFSVLSLPF